MLCKSSVLAGHNITGFDIPAIRKIKGVDLTSPVEDTLIWSRLCFSDRKEQDWKLLDHGKIPPNIVGQHGLGSWGKRLGEHKTEYRGGFDTFTQEMLDYCIQDVKVNALLYHYLRPLVPGYRSLVRGIAVVDLEQWFAEFCEDLKAYGVPFDRLAADDLLRRLLVRRAELDDELQRAFPARKEMYAVNAKTGKQTYRANADGEKVDHKLVPFNPGSRQELADRLQEKYGWKPGKFTTTGDVSMVEDILMELSTMYPEAKYAAERFIVQARIGILQEGQGSYYSLLDNEDRIHGTINHIGTVTHRCSHTKPNLGNPTSVRKPYGLDMRKLFCTAGPDYVFAGGDASGLELRMLAHYLGKWDGGAYAAVVEGGDPHNLHMEAIRSGTGFPVDRDKTKTIGYAWLYGAGDARLGAAVGKGVPAGKAIRRALRTKIQGMDPLLRGLEDRVSRIGSILSLDGRRVGIRHTHAALNSLLQSAGAVTMRWFIYLLAENLRKSGIRWGVDYIPHLFVHDELQGSLRRGLEDQFKSLFLQSFNDTKHELNLRVNLTGEVKFGRNWAETH